VRSSAEILVRPRNTRAVTQVDRLDQPLGFGAACLWHSESLFAPGRAGANFGAMARVEDAILKNLQVFVAFARKRLGDHHLAEDVVQDSFIRIFQYLVQYRHDGSFEGWVRRVCVNTCIRYLEKAKRLQVDYGMEGLPEHAVEPDAVSKMSADELMALIDKLPDGYRTVFNLSVIEGFHHKEIATMLGIEESSSRSQLTKARKYIQRSLGTTQKVAL